MKVLESKKVEGMYMFWCPGCKGLHQVPTKHTHSQNWGFNGNIDTPTFTPSILTQNTPNGNWQTACHSFVTDGKIQFLSDCPHKLAGQTVELEEINKESRFYLNWERGNY